MRNRRLFTIGGPAIAAAVALSVLLITPKHSTVNAAVIFQELRARLVDGFRLEMSNIVDDGTRVDGYLTVRFADGDNSHTLDWAVADLNVNLGADADELEGATLRVAGEFADGSSWMYLQPSNLPDDLIDRDPTIFAFFNFISNGVILDLTGLDLNDEISSFMVDDAADGATQRGLTIGIGVGAEVEEPTEAPRPGLSVDFRVDSGDSDAGGAAPGATATSVVLEEDELTALATDLVSGRATAEQLQQLVGLIENEADVQLENLSSDRIRLTAVPHADADWEAGVLTIDYLVGVGIERAEITGVGEDDGSIRMAFVDAAELERTERPSREAFSQRGAPTFRFGDLLTMLGSDH